MAWEKGKEGAAAIGELAEAWSQAVGWIHAMTDAERLELARRTAYMHLIAAAAASAPASVSLQSVAPTERTDELREALHSAAVLLERVRVGQHLGGELGEVIARAHRILG